MPLVCYHGENPHIIDQERADMILQVISDPERRKIINSIKDEAKTAIQISKETGLSISTVYRKIRELAEKHVVITSGRINSQNKREFNFKSKIRKVVTVFDNDALDVKIYTNLRDEKFS